MRRFQSFFLLWARPVLFNVSSSTVAIWAALMCVGFGSVAYSQTPTLSGNREIPDVRVQVWPGNVEDFNTRVWAYFELRGTLEKGLIAYAITCADCDDTVH